MVTTSGDGIPSYFHMLWPTVLVVRDLGGSGTIEEIDRAVIDLLGFTEEQQRVTTPSGRAVKINHRVAWARTHLKGGGLLINSARAVWSLTPAGASATEDQVRAAVTAWRADLAAQRQARQVPVPADEDEDAELAEAATLGTGDWKADLLARITQLPPAGFERLCQRLLREAGFRDVRVVGRSGDGGIDVVGTYRVSLISFQTYVQCKKYSTGSTVSSADIRNFRGAMRGIGDKGLFITTSRFTRSAGDEANRAGVEPIDLIDGDRLCDLMKEHGLGTAVEMVERVAVDGDFFTPFAES